MSPVRILHVEDEDKITRAASKFFAGFGWETTVATTVEDAQTILLEDQAFDAAIVDRRLEGTVGDELLRWIQENPKLQHMCVVMLTAHGSAHSAVAALRTGAWQFLEKPQNPVELRELLLVGIAWKRCHGVRSELFSILTRQELHRRVSGIIDLLGSVTPHIRILDADGVMCDLLGQPHLTRHDFVARVLGGEILDAHGKVEDLREYQPVSEDTRSIMAVPVHGANSTTIGMLAVESAREQAFTSYWRDFLVYLADIIGLSLIAMERVELERQAEQKKFQQLELVYHELRHTIASHAQTIALHVPKLADPQSITPERIRVIQRNAEAIEAAIRGLRDATEELSLNKVSVDLVELLTEAREDVSRTLPVQVSIAVDAAGKMPFEADPHWMRDCFQCILKNAAEALEERRRQDLDYPEDRPEVIEVSLRRGETGPVVTFKDNGVGFAAPDRDLLFQPLFSTKTTFPDGRRLETLGLDRVVEMLETARRQLTVRSETKAVLGEKKGFTVIARDGVADDVSTVAVEIRHGDIEPIVLGDTLHGDLRRGLGLYTVRRVIQRHNGTIDASSAGPFQGAEFVIRLHESPGRAEA